MVLSPSFGRQVGGLIATAVSPPPHHLRDLEELDARICTLMKSILACTSPESFVKPLEQINGLFDKIKVLYTRIKITSNAYQKSRLEAIHVLLKNIHLVKQHAESLKSFASFHRELGELSSKKSVNRTRPKSLREKGNEEIKESFRQLEAKFTSFKDAIKKDALEAGDGLAYCQQIALKTLEERMASEHLLLLGNK